VRQRKIACKYQSEYLNNNQTAKADEERKSPNILDMTNDHHRLGRYDGKGRLLSGATTSLVSFTATENVSATSEDMSRLPNLFLFVGFGLTAKRSYTILAHPNDAFSTTLYCISLV
jgi:hypothetical protein